MKKCLKINVIGTFSKNFLSEVVQKNARDLHLEGLAQHVNQNKVRIILCGMQDLLDNFLDVLHASSLEWHIDDIQVEPFLNDKDYRGVFRIIE